jgi:hypothetical protein
VKKLLFILLILVSQFSFGKLSEDEYKKVESMVFESLKKDNFLKVNRVTQGGKLTSCELEFGQVYRDYRSQSGKPVIVSGSFSLMYFRDKDNILTSIKVVPSIIDVRSEKWVQTYPQFLDFKINKKTLESYKVTDFKCGSENNGRCKGYGDGKLEVLKLVTSSNPFNGEVIFSFTNGGYDNQFLLSSLLPPKESFNIRSDFNLCMSEILDEVVKDLNKRK